MDFVVFHAKKVDPFRPCMDGLFAALAAREAMPDARMVPACYGAENAPKLALTKRDRVFLLDLTYPAPILESWADSGAEVIVLDHHKSAMDDLVGLSDRILAKFDMQRSGAVMAWQYFVGGAVPMIFQYVQDRDLWTKQLPDCDLISLGLSEAVHGKTLEEAFAVIENWEFLLCDMRELGETVEVESKAAIANAVANHQTRCVLGYTVPFYRCRTKREFQAYSDIGNALMNVKVRRSLFGKPETPPFAVVQTGDGWALRSDSRGIDVTAIAKMLGGGGHRNASGCRAG
jgi:uncharacterized protein